mmetsp:Transcript_19512/g.49609  ORF Transcript_19512/g.49609 Transcript_19512/m.49609 type:complete len:102 (+) Transcript_19512:161-466(+)
MSMERLADMLSCVFYRLRVANSFAWLADMLPRYLDTASGKVLENSQTWAVVTITCHSGYAAVALLEGSSKPKGSGTVCKKGLLHHDKGILGEKLAPIARVV